LLNGARSVAQTVLPFHPERSIKKGAAAPFSSTLLL
jgi:hypothetical protein